jgi:hypothetical protein
MTTPDWLYVDPTDPSVKVAIYLDGMSRGLHGGKDNQQMDQLLRQMLELSGYTVIIIQTKDLSDPEALRLHLRNLAQALHREDLVAK